MDTLVRTVIAGQYGAALKMLLDALDRAGPDAWLAPVGRFPFWHVGYHVLFVTDLYLSPDESAFRRQPFHREDYDELGTPAGAPDKVVVTDQPYDPPTLVAYADTCRAKAKQSLESESDATLAGPSGFSRLRFTRLELHLYNIRHVQHHVGQLTAALRRSGGDVVRWSLSEPL